MFLAANVDIFSLLFRVRGGFLRAVLLRTVELFGSPLPLFSADWMELESIYSESTMRCLKILFGDGVIRKLNRNRGEFGCKHISGFVYGDVHSPARHQREMFDGKNRNVLNSAEPSGPTFRLHFCLGHA